MMLAAEVQRQIRRFVVGLINADDLSDWLDAQARGIHATGDGELLRLVNLTFSLLEDVFQGHRTDQDVRLLLSETISPVHSHTIHVFSMVDGTEGSPTIGTVAMALSTAPTASGGDWPVESPRTEACTLLPR